MEGPQKFIAIFKTSSTFFATIFVITALIFLALFGLLVFLVRKMEAKQMSYAKLAAKVAHDMTPVLTTGISTAGTISTGTEHACAVLTDQKLKCWALNSAGQLGNATRTNSLVPVSVYGIKNYFSDPQNELRPR